MNPMESNWTKPRRSEQQGFGLARDAGGRLVLIDAQGHRHVDVEAICGFPLTDPTHMISICDSVGRELVYIEDIEDVPANTRKVLEAALADRKFMPVIERITSISVDVEPSRWHVQTDRGEITFQLKSDDDVRKLEDGRILIVDDQGIRYLIPHISSLDSVSRRALERFIV